MQNKSTQDSALEVLQRRLERERLARKEAENLLTEKSAELYKAIQESEDRERKLAMALWASREAIWSMNKDRQTVEVVRWPSGSTEQETLTLQLDNMLKQIHKSDLPSFQRSLDNLLSGRQPIVDVSVRIKFGEGYRWITYYGRLVEHEDILCIGISKDITKQRETEHVSQLMAMAFEKSRDALVVLNADGTIKDSNQAMQTLTRMSEEHLTGVPLHKLFNLNSVDIETGNRVEVEFVVDRKTGLTIVTELVFSRFYSDAHDSHHTIATIRDITDRKKAQETLMRLATHDSLTRLPNRTAFQRSLLAQISERTNQEQISVCFLDLDGFKTVNDDLGHDAGDYLLTEAAERLRRWLPSHATLARWGGDEFLVAVKHDDAAIATSCAEQIIAEISKPILIDSVQVSISASVGLATLPVDADDPSELIKCADIAMYEAKALGKNQFCRYTTALAEKSKNKISMLSAVRHAITVNEFDFYLQPKINTLGQIVGAEALARWTSGVFGAVSPAVFIPLIEEHGLAIEFGLLVLETCANYAKLLSDVGEQIPIAVNVSSYQLMSNDFVSSVVRVCKDARIDHSLLEIEVTESVFLQESDLPIKNLNQLREAGFTIAIDDFGTGYSSLSYLRELPFDIVKIDRSFVVDADQNQRASALLKGIISMCHDVNMSVVAEGVETQGEFDLLRELSVEFYQGYLFGKPMPFEDLVAEANQPFGHLT